MPVWMQQRIGAGGGVRRWVGYAGLALAAAASIATSEPTWTVEDAIRGLKDTLTANEPEATRHFSVDSSDSHTVRVVGWVKWDINPAADVSIRISKDDGSPAQETVIRSADAELVGPGRYADSYVSLGQHQVCEGAPCKQGYTVTLTRSGGASQEKTEIEWAFEVRMTGDGKDEPAGAFVTVTED